MDRLLLRLRPGHDLPGDYMPVLARHNAQITRRFPLEKMVVVQTPGKDAELLALDLEASNAGIVYPDSLGKVQGAPNDPYYTGTSGTQPYLTNINCETAWNTFKLNGRTDIPVVIDIGTGCNSHVDLNLATGWDIIHSTSTFTDNSSIQHGTACMGPIAAITNNSSGIASLGWGGYGMSVACAAITDSVAISDFLAGLSWILANVTAPAVITCSQDVSVGGSGVTFYNTAAALWNAGFVLIGSAGDTGTSTCVTSNCRMPWFIPVASCDNTFARDSYSNYGVPTSNDGGFAGLTPGVQVCAIVGGSSGSPIFRTTASNSSFGLYWGTSFAAPQVAALAQYIWAANPRLKNFDIVEIITNPANGNATTGFGSYTVPCIDANKMLQAAINYKRPAHAGASLLRRR
jgi:serine protease